jgi:Carboxypeptidase regulatory-like domain/TonB dependent receptor/TonB-dependent Receptor Plug Domain
MNQSFRYLTVLAAFLMTLSMSALSQSATATLSGTVTDPSGANIASATVTLQNSGTGGKHTTTTNDEGLFTLPLLPPGNYTLTVMQTGFATTESRDLVLNVGDQRSLQIQLKVSGVAADVNVTSDVALLNESPSVGTVVNRQFVENLPLNGRSFQSLINLTPGVAPTDAGEFGGGGQFSVNGQRGNANYFTVDGVSANIGIGTGYVASQGASGALPGLSAQGGTNNLVSIEALEEFRVLTSTFAPEFGRMPGGQVQIVTRSGTNQWRGTLFNYLRNDVFDANDFFGNANGLQRPALRQNDFGGVLGGPVVRDKAFFFFSYEGLRLRQPQSLVTTTPSLRVRRLVTPALQTMLNAFPTPTGAEFINPTTGLPTGTAPLAASYSDPSTLNATSLRMDYHFTERLKVFGRYNYAPSDSARRGAAPFNAGTLSTIGLTRARTQTLTLGATQVLSARISNDFRFNYSLASTDSRFTIDNFGGAVAPNASTLLPSFVTAENGLLYFDTRDAGVLSFGRDSFNQNQQFNFVNNLSAVTGNHTLQFGVDYRRLLPLLAKTADGKGLYSNFLNYSGISGNGELTDAEARATSGLMLSSLTGYSSTYNQYPAPMLVQNFSAYAQDAWRIGRRATLMYGLRYEVNPAASGRDDARFVVVRNPYDSARATFTTPGTAIYETTWNNFAPRVGLSYALSQRAGRETIVRGGVGLFYDLGAGATNFAASGFPFNTGGSLNGSATTFPLTTQFAARPSFGQSSGFSEVAAPDPNLQLPRVWQFNLAVEQSLGNQQTISATYVGALGRRLILSEYVYTTLPNFYAFVTSTNAARSDYHALQLQFQRRLSKGFQALANYTWSHSIDDASSDTLLLGNQAREARLNRGSSDFDLRQTFNAALTWNVAAPDLGRAGNALLRGFALDAVINARSAPVVNLIGGYAFGGASYRVSRPDYVAGQPLYKIEAKAPGRRVLNPAAFKAPPTDENGNVTRQGTLGRGVVRGFDLWQFDLALRRQFNLTERMNLQFRIEAFNVFNRANFARPVADITNPLFGQATSLFNRGLGAGGTTGGLNPLYQIGGPRSLQMSLKLHF